MWFCYQIFLLLSVVESLVNLCFLTFCIIFQKPAFFISLKKSFLKSLFAIFLKSVLFISIYGVSQAFWLNSITLWTFFKTITWFNACFKFIMCTTYSVLSWKSETNFWTLLIFIPRGKNGKSLGRSFNFSRYWRSTTRKYPLSHS